MSDPDRPKNTFGDKYSDPEIYVYSDAVAAVVFAKSNGEKCLAMFYWIAAKNNPYWQYFVLTDSHYAGITQLASGPLYRTVLTYNANQKLNGKDNAQ